MELQPTPLTEAELDTIFKSADLVVPPALKAGVYAEALQLKRVTGLLRQPRNHRAEPSNIFSLIRRT